MNIKRYSFALLAALAALLIGGHILVMAVRSAREAALLAGIGTPVPYAEGASFAVDAAHDCAFVAEEGERITLFDYLGTPVLLHFWNGEGEAELAELQALERAYQEYGEQIIFLPVHTQGTQSRSEAEAFYRRESLALPLFFDEDGSAIEAYGKPQAPVTYFIDAEGFIAASSTGSIDEDTLLFGLSLLSDLTTPAPSPSASDPAATAAPAE